MPQAADNWLHFTPRQPKRKRADLVCIHCHAKKIKCDLQVRQSFSTSIVVETKRLLQARTNSGAPDCTSCSNSGHDCQIRPSKRTKQKRDQIENDNASLHSHVGRPNNGIHETNRTFNAHQPMSNDSSAPGLVASLQQHQESFNVHLPLSHNPKQNHIPRLQAEASEPSRGRLGLSHAGDVDTGFLHVYTAEDDRNAEEQDREANAGHTSRTSEPFYDELLPIFSETYFDFCYAFCPVLDPEMIHEAMSSSPLLANSVALVASNVRPPLLPHIGPAENYKKAREIFYDDGEADSLTTLQALCLFYWWAPRPPSTAHRHSSWWWTSIIIRIAQQMNIHREPTTSVAVSDMRRQSLRRRVWWTAYVCYIDLISSHRNH